MTAPLLTIHDLSKRFEDVVALENVDLQVAQGEFLSLLGPSGCGKSTLLRLISGLETPSSGRIDWRAGARRDLGVVFQEPTLAPWSSVFDNVWLPLRLKGRSRREARAEVEQAIAQVGLAGFERAYPRELSGGMKMRVSIARAMVTRPSLLLMDEPFAALDEITRFQLNDDLLALKARLGCTVIFVTHSVFESVYLSDRIAVMAARPGRIVHQLPVAAPEGRDAAFRTSPHYAALCREVSDALRDAMEVRAA